MICKTVALADGWWLVVDVIAENQFEILIQPSEIYLRLLQVFPDAVPIEAVSAPVTPLVFLSWPMLPPDEWWYSSHLN